jgi:DNA-binding response OmpR family regulator
MAEHVLIVDDNADLVELMRMVLADAGYVTRCARDGRQALDAVARAKPALVLLDMLMPVMNGWDCARELRKRYGSSIPIVIATAAEHAGARASEVAADDVLPKPFDTRELVSMVERHLGPPRQPAQRH